MGKPLHGSAIWISGNSPSSKNSKQWTGKFLVSSKTVSKYVKDSKNQWIDNKDKFKKLLEGKKKPYIIGFHFVRKSKHRSDFINLCQLAFDLMVKYEWLDDDNMDEVLPQCVIRDGKFYTYNKDEPGVYIYVL